MLIIRIWVHDRTWDKTAHTKNVLDNYTFNFDEKFNFSEKFIFALKSDFFENKSKNLFKKNQFN